MPGKSQENLTGKGPESQRPHRVPGRLGCQPDDSKSGTITLFAFDAGEGLSEHTALYDAVANIIDGDAEISIEQTPFLLKEGQMIIMPANKPHALHAQQRFKMMLTMVHE